MRRPQSTTLFVFIWCMTLSEGQSATTLNLDPGEDIRLNCSTEPSRSVDWQYRPREDAEDVSIYIGNFNGGGFVSSDYKSRPRYQVLVDVTMGQYDLVIRNITKSDAGLYTCTDVSNPSISQKTAIVVSGDKAELCSNDVSSVLHGVAYLSFPTRRTDSIQLEHRAIGQQYLLHVYRDGKIINDYYVQSGRFSVNVSAESWNLMISDVQKTDAGVFVCSEDNGMGAQYKRELVVVDRVSHVEVNGVCSPEVLEVNITCSANYTGNCPPRLELHVGRTSEGDGEKLNLTNGPLTMDGRTASTTTRLTTKQLQYKPEIFCVISTPSSHVILNHTKSAQITGCSQDPSNSEVNLKYLGFLIFIVIPIILIIAWAIYKVAKKRKPGIRLPKGNEEEQIPMQMLS